MAGTWRGLSGLESAAVRSPPCAMERRRGARTRALRWQGGPPERRPAAYFGRLARGLSRQAEPVYDASGRGAVCARRALFRDPAHRVAYFPIPPFLCPARRLSRRRRGSRSHFDRLLQQLCKVREAARARTGGARPELMKVLVTGAAGFIGMHLAQRLREDGADVVAVDSFDPYYDVALKRARAARLLKIGVRCEALDLADTSATAAFFRSARLTHVAHMAAQPGVRYSLVNPAGSLRNTVYAFGAVLEGCRHGAVEHLVYASSSSVYGANHTLPFSEDQNVDHPVSLYAATKKANELMAHSYSHLYGMAATGLRFFTVYGPWGRPDMSPMLFTRAMLEGRPIKVFNYGKMQRDFTYIDDIVEGVVRVLSRPPVAAASSVAPSAIYNIGNHTAIELETFISELERLLGVRAIREYEPLQPGDVPMTYASIERLAAATGFAPATSLSVGLASFVQWYREYYGEGKTA